MPKPLVLIGAGEFAQIACDYFQHDSDYDVVAFSVERDYLAQPMLADRPVLAFESLQETFPPAEVELFVAIPASQLNRLRTRLYRQAKAGGYRFATYVSSRAFVWRNADIGENCFVFEHSVVQPFARVGHNCVVWSGSFIGHRAVLQENAFVAPHATINGYCEIGEHSFIGANATCKDRVRVGADCVIGAGALVLGDTEPGRVYAGSPAHALPGRSAFDVRF